MESGCHVRLDIRVLMCSEGSDQKKKDMLTESVFPYVVILMDTCRNTEREGEERDLQGFI